MKRRGPPPKPSALKALAGNPGKRKLNRAEPKLPVAARMPAPAVLDAAAKAEWARLEPLLSAAKVLTAGDRSVLAAYCHAWSRWCWAVKKIAELDEPFASTKSGYPQPHPLVAMEQQYQKLMVGNAQELGLTPAARSRVSSVGDGASDDPDDDFLNGGVGGKAASAEIAFQA